MPASLVRRDWICGRQYREATACYLAACVKLRRPGVSQPRRSAASHSGTEDAGASTIG
jgi:hypothetical protein